MPPSTLLGEDQADMVSLGRGALTHPDWPDRVRTGMPIDTFDGRILAPIADLANADRQTTLRQGTRQTKLQLDSVVGCRAENAPPESVP